MFGKHSIQALLAYEFMDTSAKVINAKGTGIVSGFEVLDATATPEEVGGNLTEWAKQSVFARQTILTTTAILQKYLCVEMVPQTLVMTRSMVISSLSVVDGTSTAKNGSRPTG